MADKKKVTPDDLTGTKLSQTKALAGMRHFQEQRAVHVREQAEKRVHLSRLRDRINVPMLQQVATNSDALDALAEWRREMPSLTKASPPEARPVQPRVFPGFGAILTPPYPYQASSTSWPWCLTIGDAKADATASAALGSMALDCRAAGKQPGTANATAAVGIYFYPPVSNAWVKVYCNPLIAYSWSDFLMFGQARTDAYIGFLIMEYELNGRPTGNGFGKTWSLWNDSSGGFAADIMPYSAWLSFFQADDQHQYTVMLECGVEAYGDGQREEIIDQLPEVAGGGTVEITQVDMAFGSLGVTVPYIGWEIVG